MIVDALCDLKPLLIFVELGTGNARRPSWLTLSSYSAISSTIDRCQHNAPGSHCERKLTVAVRGSRPHMPQRLASVGI